MSRISGGGWFCSTIWSRCTEIRPSVSFSDKLLDSVEGSCDIGSCDIGVGPCDGTVGSCDIGVGSCDGTVGSCNIGVGPCDGTVGSCDIVGLCDVNAALCDTVVGSLGSFSGALAGSVVIFAWSANSLVTPPSLTVSHITPSPITLALAIMD